MDIALLLFLILLNGVLAMSEIAVVSSRQSRLKKLADDGSVGARSALALHHEPSTFLSTVQVGITTVGILSGAIGEATLAAPMARWLSTYPSLAPYASGIAMTLVVIIVTYFSVVIGELVPKRLGLLAPERVASLIAPADEPALATGSPPGMAALVVVQPAAGPAWCPPEAGIIGH
jgi:putative hemolysin